MYLALKEIKKEKLRFILIIVVTALIAFVVYFLASLAFGLAQLNRTSIDYWKSEGIIISKSANRNIYSSTIDLNKVEELSLNIVDGINVASATVYINDEKQGTPTDLVFMGYDLNSRKITAPVIEGRTVNSENEIIISSNIRNEIDIKLNDTVIVAKSKRQFKVVGFTQDSNYNTVPVAYVSKKMATQDMLLYEKDDPEIASVASPNTNLHERVSAILIYDSGYTDNFKDTDLEYINIDDFIKNLPGYQAQILTFGLMIVSLATISSIIIGIFMYILTMQKKSIFGVLKIQGYQNLYIMKSVLYQSILLIIVGFSIGLLLTIVTVNYLPAKVPVEIFWPLNIVVTLFAVVCSFLGTLFSARNVLKIDPLEAL
ncbi:ABC transporter permease [Erysipelothrix urinaevulpis]|uniref:ABC transporter permease n=1 Tax=Erysipelothrix urinaevulpis TaxID=2683717 RepID=UPI00135CDA8B|nr:FtsX-like permease family protein [Erysipelothrix urinaevulpis]